MKNCVKLNWPSLGETEHKKIIDCFNKNLDLVHYPTSTVQLVNHRHIDLIYHTKADTANPRAGFYHLYNWDNYVQFFEDLFKDHHINSEVLEFFSIQRSLKRVYPHSDTGRRFIVYYFVEGYGDTVFYNCDKFVSGVSYHNRRDELTEIERISMTPGNWYLFNNYRIHSVENMSPVRYSLAFDISKIVSTYEYAHDHIEDSKILFL